MKYYNLPDEKGHFEKFGGKFIPETLMQAVIELEKAYNKYYPDTNFQNEFHSDLKHFVGRPTPLYFSQRLTQYAGGAKIYFKREDLTHTGAHKINNTIGQILLAKSMGKKRIIAETGAGQHGVATATVCARNGLECHVYMGSKDIKRQSLNVYRMKLMGANVIPVTANSQSLKEALNEALRDWVTNIDNTYYVIGTVAGPHPYPLLVRNFQSVMGKETKEQAYEQIGDLPDAIVACVGGGSNAIGIFHEFIGHKDVALYGVEAAGRGMNLSVEDHCASLTAGKVGVLHGCRTYLLQNNDGQIVEGHSVSAGLDYPGVGPEHAYLKSSGRVEYVGVSDEEAISAFRLLNKIEGILPALETSHAISYAIKLATKMPKNKTIVVNLSGRGDKDINTIAKMDNMQI